MVPTAYTSGPVPDTTEVWIFVSSSLALAKVSNFTVAPVCALNLSLTDFCQAWNSCGYCVLAPISTLRVLPAPLPPPLLPPSPPHAASAAASTVVLARATTERIVLKPIVVLLLV